ncbi:MAG: serine hydrolase domain-containing protein [Planctomycetota bacterium]
MMRHSKTLACVGVLAGLALCGIGAIGRSVEAGPSDPSNVEQDAMRVAQAHLDSGALHGGVAVVLADGLVSSSYRGRVSEPNGAAIGGETRFRIASLTKVLTRIAILRLIDEGRLDLDDTLAVHRPGFDADWARDITIRDLLTFRSGLPRERAGAADPVEAGVRFADDGRAVAHLDSLVQDGPTLAPGTRVLYSNLGYFHLGGVIETVTGMPTAEAFDALIFKPLGLKNTTLGEPDQARASSIAIGHRRSADGALEPVPDYAIERRYTAGGYISTVEDLAALSTALINEQFLSAPSLELLLNGFGDNDGATLRAAGLVPGFASVWSISSEPPSAVIVLNNAVGANPNEIVQIHDEIADALRANASKEHAESPRVPAEERINEGWVRLERDGGWPRHELVPAIRTYLERFAVADPSDLYDAGLKLRGLPEEEVDEDSRGAYRWMAGYQVALRDRYGPFVLAWWRPGENEALEFLMEGPAGRALRFRVGPSAQDPTLASVFAVATVGFDADQSLYEEASGLD